MARKGRGGQEERVEKTACYSVVLDLPRLASPGSADAWREIHTERPATVVVEAPSPSRRPVVRSLYSDEHAEVDARVLLDAAAAAVRDYFRSYMCRQRRNGDRPLRKAFFVASDEGCRDRGRSDGGDDNKSDGDPARPHGAVSVDQSIHAASCTIGRGRVAVRADRHHVRAV